MLENTPLSPSLIKTNFTFGGILNRKLQTLQNSPEYVVCTNNEADIGNTMVCIFNKDQFVHSENSSHITVYVLLKVQL